MSFRLENRSGYDTGDLRRFFAAGLRATKTKTRLPLRIVVTSAPRRSRGCAEVGGCRMVISLSPPSYNPAGFMRRLARMFEHETAHLRGQEHGHMPRQVLYSLGSLPDWARGLKIRYHGKAPAQLPFLRDRKATRG